MSKRYVTATRKLQIIWRFFAGRKDDESIARGVGLGLFIGFLPLVGLQIILALFLSPIFGANRMIAVIATTVTNPFTALPVGIFSIFLGDLFLPGDISISSNLGFSDFSWFEFSKKTKQILPAYLIGCFILSWVFGTLGYAMTKIFYKLRLPGR